MREGGVKEEGEEMSEEQKKQAERITAEMAKLPQELREGALLFLQGMAATAKLMNERKEA